MKPTRRVAFWIALVAIAGIIMLGGAGWCLLTQYPTSNRLVPSQVVVPQVAFIQAAPSQGSAPLEVIFSGAVPAGGYDSFVRYSLDFGDGSAAAVLQAAPTDSSRAGWIEFSNMHTYERPGTYSVRLQEQTVIGWPHAVATVSVVVTDGGVEQTFLNSKSGTSFAAVSNPQNLLEATSSTFVISGWVQGVAYGTPTLIITASTSPESIPIVHPTVYPSYVLWAGDPTYTDVRYDSAPHDVPQIQWASFKAEVSPTQTYPALFPGVYYLGLYSEKYDTSLKTDTLSLLNTSTVVVHGTEPTLFTDTAQQFSIQVPNGWQVTSDRWGEYIASPDGSRSRMPNFTFQINSNEEDGYGPNTAPHVATDMPSLIALYKDYLKMDVTQVSVNGNDGIEFPNPYQGQLNIVILRQNGTFVHFWCDYETANSMQKGMPGLCENSALSFKDL